LLRHGLLLASRSGGPRGGGAATEAAPPLAPGPWSTGPCHWSRHAVSEGTRRQLQRGARRELAVVAGPGERPARARRCGLLGWTRGLADRRREKVGPALPGGSRWHDRHPNRGRHTLAPTLVRARGWVVVVDWGPDRRNFAPCRTVCGTRRDPVDGDAYDQAGAVWPPDGPPQTLMGARPWDSLGTTPSQEGSP
jgi:hypothetical protein